MFVRRLATIAGLLCCLIAYSQLQSDGLQLYDLIVQDIYQSLLESGKTVDFEELSDDLMQLKDNPININTATEEQLRQLLFLSDKQIDDILLFVYQHPLQSLYELRLVGSLEDYEVRNMLPFLTAEPVDRQNPIHWREMWHYAKSELLARTDARSIEDNGKDPFYVSLKYKFNYKNRVEWGLVMERDPQEPFYVKGKTYGADFYGGYLQLRDIWKFKTIVAGDYKASFGEGLVLNTNMSYGGKIAYLQTNCSRKEGLQRKTSTAEYDFLRGAGATVRLGRTDITALYSARKVDGKVEEGVFPSVQRTGYHRTDNELAAKREVWQQVAGMNVTLRLRQWRLGLTAAANLLGDTLLPKANYYNQHYFRGRQQYAVGANYAWYYKKISMFGELATASNSRWGIATVNGIRLTAASGIDITAVYRFYSLYYDNMLSSAFGESSHANDENGLMLGIEVRRLKNWRLTAYTDVFHFADSKYQIHGVSTGFDVMLKAEYTPSDKLSMQILGRSKLKGDKDKTTFRYAVAYNIGQWTVKAIAEGNIVCLLPLTDKPTLGGVIAPQVEWRARRVPITLQARAELFYANVYDNRLYLYENDVLYAFSVPMIYGCGGRWLLNFRYKISDRFSIYLKAAQTIWTDEWRTRQGYNSSTRTEIHTLLRIKI